MPKEHARKSLLHLVRSQDAHSHCLFIGPHFLLVCCNHHKLGYTVFGASFLQAFVLGLLGEFGRVRPHAERRKEVARNRAFFFATFSGNQGLRRLGDPLAR